MRELGTTWTHREETEQGHQGAHREKEEVRELGTIGDIERGERKGPPIET